MRAAAPPGLFNDPGNILALDNLLDAFSVPRENGGLAVSQRGIDLIKEFEGLRLTAYPDPGTGGAPWTIGWGATTDETGRTIRPGKVWTRDRADKRLEAHVAQFAAEVTRALDGAPTTQAQFDAMVSFAFNLGTPNFAGSTLLRKHKAGDYTGAANEFARWNKAGGRVMPGLTRRRAAEAALYRSGTP